MFVYAHYRKTDSSIFYIGVAKSEKRFTSKYSRNVYWKNIVEKNGFYYDILFKSDDWGTCLKKEIELIKYYGRFNNNTGILCNMTDGGEGCVNLSTESKNKISNKLRGVKRSDEFKANCIKRMQGTKASIETRFKMSESHKKVDKSYLKNRALTNDHRKNISKSKKGKSIGIGKILTEDHKKAISKGFKSKFSNNQLKQIMEMHNNNISLREISLKMESNHTTIKRYINLEIEKL